MLFRSPTDVPPEGAPGRVSGPHGTHRLQPRHSPREAADIAFARLVCDRLRRALDAHRMDAFCLVAAPHFLGLLRNAMDEPLRRSLLRDLPQDLTRQTPREIREHLLRAA